MSTGSSYVELGARFLQVLLVGQAAHACHHATCNLSIAGEFATSVGFSAASALIDGVLSTSSSPTVEIGSETRCPAALPAVPDCCVRLVQAATGGKRGDEGGAPSRVRCRGRMRTCDQADEVGPGCLGRPHPPATALARHRSGGGRHAVPGGRQEPPSVATASVCGSPVHGACGGFLVVSSKNLEIITNDERIRTDVRRNKVHADALRPCTRNLGVRTACGSEAHGRRGHGDASEAFQGQDDLL